MNKAYIFLIGLLFSCSNNETTESTNKAINKFSLEIEDIKYNWDFTRNLSLYPILITKKEFSEGRLLSISDDGNSLYLNDIKNFVLHEIDRNLETIKIRGKKGDGLPDENGFIMSVDFFDPFNYFIYDFSKRMVKIFDKNDSLITYQKLHNKSIYRASPGEYLENYLVAEPSMDYSNLNLSSYSISSNNILNKNSILEALGLDEFKEAYLALDGRFITNDLLSNHIIYLFSHTGKLLLIDKLTGNIKSVHNTLDNTPVPKVEIKNISGNLIPRLIPDTNFNLAGTIKNNQLYILTIVNYNSNPIIDVYNIDNENINYHHSIPLPRNEMGESIIDFSIIKDELFLLTDNQSIFKYKIQKYETD